MVVISATADESPPQLTQVLTFGSKVVAILGVWVAVVEESPQGWTSGSVDCALLKLAKSCLEPIDYSSATLYWEGGEDAIM